MLDVSAPDFPLKMALALALAPVAWRLLQPRPKPNPNAIANIPGPSGGSYMQGHFTDLFSNDSWAFHRLLAEKYGRTSRIQGPMGEEMIYTYDPKAMYQIFIKDQYLYEETYFFIANNHVLFGPGLLAMTGDAHRRQRKMLNPVFSVAHLRHMVPTFYDISEQLRETLFKKVKQGEEEADIVTWMTRAALEIMGQSGLGTAFSPLTEEAEEHEYITSVKRFGPLMTLTLLPRLLILPLVYKYNLGGSWLQRFVVSIWPSKPIRQFKDMIDTMHRTSVGIFEAKKKAMAQADSEEGHRLGESKDIIGILMRENAKASAEDKFTDEEVTAQMSTLILAATDTTSSALARILHQLSMHNDVQDKLRAELRQAREDFGERPDYDQLTSLPYLDAVCRETLRLFPPVATVVRETQADAVLPISTPVKGVNGEDVSEIHLPKDAKVFVSIQACNTDPALWGPDSYEWKPERWLEPLPQSVSDAHIPGVYSNLMTFIGGGRACIGFKFSQLEMKIILFTLLNKFRVSLPKEKIYWQMTIVTSPTVDPKLSELRPRMPLALSLLDDN